MDNKGLPVENSIQSGNTHKSSPKYRIQFPIFFIFISHFFLLPQQNLTIEEHPPS